MTDSYSFLTILIPLVLFICIVVLVIVFYIRRLYDRQEKVITDELRDSKARLEDSLKHISELQMQLDRRAEDDRRTATMEFRSAAAETMRSQLETLRDSNTAQIDAVLRPLRDQLGEFRRAVDDSFVRDNASRQSLSDQIERLMTLNVSIGEEARNLTSALKGNSKVQGDWGEMVLESLLESAGLKRDVNFKVQPAADVSGKALRDSDTGRALRPDVMIMLPEDRVLVIDSKVSLTAFTEYHQADDDARRRKAAARHLESVKHHVDELAAKKYQMLFPNAADQVLMFVPNDNAWSLAFSLDDSLWKYAFDKKVTIVSPAHLFSVMLLVNQMWRQENQNRNALEIARLGGLLYDRFVTFTTDFSAIQTALQRASRAYDDCYRDLTAGSQSLVARSERLRDLGARTSRRLSSDFLSSASDSPSQEEQ